MELKNCLIIVGAIRNFRDTYEGFNRLIDFYGLDVHLFVSESRYGKESDEDFIEGSIHNLKILQFIDDIDLPEWIPNTRNEVNPHSLYNYLNKNKIAGDHIIKYMVDNNIQYHNVFKFRPDVFLRDIESIVLKEGITYTGESDKIYDYCIGDIYIITGFEKYVIYSNLIDNLQTYFSENIIFHHETMNGYHMKIKNGFEIIESNRIWEFEYECDVPYGYTRGSYRYYFDRIPKKNRLG